MLGAAKEDFRWKNDKKDSIIIDGGFTDLRHFIRCCNIGRFRGVAVCSKNRFGCLR